MKKKKGFTLIEVTVSIALLSVIILFVVNFINLLRKNEDGVSVDSKLYLNRELTSEYLNNDAKENGAATNVYCEDNTCYIYYANGEARSLSIDETKTKLEFRNIGTDRTIYSKKIEEGYEYALELEQRANYYVLNVLVDNYPKYTTEMVIENGVGYVYWSIDDLSSDGLFENNQIPDTVHQSISDLGFTTPHTFIRTTMVKNKPTKHETCIYVNERIFCFDTSYYDEDYDANEIRLKTLIEEALDMPLPYGCYHYSGTTEIFCYSSDPYFNIQIGSYDNDGQTFTYAQCLTNSDVSSVGSDGLAEVRKYN